MKILNVFLLIVLIIVILAVGGYFGAKYYLSTQVGLKYLFVHPTIAKIFSLTPTGVFYRNSGYGFEMIFPETWKGFTVHEKTWQGQGTVNGDSITDSGKEIIIKNPQTTSKQAWQDIPIMVFSHSQWLLVSNENGCGPDDKNCGFMAVSAAPIGPAKIGENSKYVFATPPRWYGFTDAVGFQEATEIVKTFKGYKFNQ